MAPFTDPDGDDDDAYGDKTRIVVPREHLLPLSVSINRKLTTLCPHMDDWLRGGVPTRSVTEFVGEAGAGKTQLVLQLLLSAQLPESEGGLDGSAVYVHTEGRAPVGRLKQIADCHPALLSFQKSQKKEKHDFLKNVILVQTLDDPGGLWTALASVAQILEQSNSPEPTNLKGSDTANPGAGETPNPKRKPVRVLVVDSVSSPFREGDASKKKGAVERSHALSRIAALLREYAHRHEICVVVTNHVVDHVDDSRRNDANPKVNHRNVFGPPGVLTTSGRNVTPALGLFWANCVNSRIFLKRTGGSASGFGGNEGVGGGGVVGGVTRHASVVFSSHLPHGKDVNEGGASVRFEVRKQGVFGVACDG